MRPTYILDRAYTILCERVGHAPPDRLARPFGLNPTYGLVWHVGTDTWDRLLIAMEPMGVVPAVGAGPTLYGVPVIVNRAASPYLMELGPASHPTSHQPTTPEREGEHE